MDLKAFVEAQALKVESKRLLIAEERQIMQQTVDPARDADLLAAAREGRVGQVQKCLALGANVNAVETRVCLSAVTAHTWRARSQPALLLHVWHALSRAWLPRRHPGHSPARHRDCSRTHSRAALR